MENSVEIAYSNKFICPNQASVDLLRTEEGQKLGAQSIDNFSIIKVPQRVSDILAGFDSKKYAGIIRQETTPWELVQEAMNIAGHTYITEDLGIADQPDIQAA